jgi:hypothetical protein
MTVSTRERHAWAAGMIDGEGGIYLKWSSYTEGFRVRVEVNNTNRECLDVLKEHFGCGSVGLTSKAKGCWRWVVSDRLALRVLEHCEEFMVIKRALALDTLNAQDKHGWTRDEIWSDQRKTARKGLNRVANIRRNLKR